MKTQRQAIEALILELQGMVRVWERGWKVEKELYIANANKTIDQAVEVLDRRKR
jgi:hypothetical protein